MLYAGVTENCTLRIRKDSWLRVQVPEAEETAPELRARKSASDR